MMEANAIQVRIGELCHQFRLPRVRLDLPYHPPARAF